jgi:hypothetical protein
LVPAQSKEVAIDDGAIDFLCSFKAEPLVWKVLLDNFARSLLSATSTDWATLTAIQTSNDREREDISVEMELAGVQLCKLADIFWSSLYSMESMDEFLSLCLSR